MTCRVAPAIALAVALALAGTGLGPPPSRASDNGAAANPGGSEALNLNGFVSSSWSYNSNRPDSRKNQLRVFDFDDNSFKLDVFELAAQLPAARLRDTGFRVDLALGSSVPRVSASAGLFRDAAGTAQDADLQQAYASWIAPVGPGLRLDAGKFITSFGYEVIEGYDGWNDNATRSLLFGYAIPFTHVGVRASCVYSPRISATAMVVNGWDVAVDNNRSKSVGVQLALTPAPPFTLWLNGMAGPERADSERDSRHLFDAIALWKADARRTFAVDAFVGTEPHAALDGGNATWKGIALYARIAIDDDFAMSLRGETFDDRDGARTGVAQRLSEFTLTPELRLTKRATVRADLRVDRSNVTAFEKGSGHTDTQATALLNVLFSF